MMVEHCDRCYKVIQKGERGETYVRIDYRKNGYHLTSVSRVLHDECAEPVIHFLTKQGLISSEIE